MSNISIWPIDRNLSGVTTPGQSGLGNDGNEELWIPQSSSITWASPSDSLVPYPGLSLGESYPSAEMQLVYFTAPADWALGVWGIWSIPSLPIWSIQSDPEWQYLLGCHLWVTVSVQHFVREYYLLIETMHLCWGCLYERWIIMHYMDAN